MAKIFYTPPGYTGSSELTASNGLVVINSGRWTFSKSGYNDGATFGLSLTHPKPMNGDELHLAATNWEINQVGNNLTSYYNSETGETYSADQCRIQVTGQWQVIRQPNSNSYNSFGVSWSGTTDTDQGGRLMNPYLLTYISGFATYTIQGSAVTGGAQDTFSSHEFYCRVTEAAQTDNSNKEFQSNTITRPVWVYTYTKSWEITV